MSVCFIRKIHRFFVVVVLMIYNYNQLPSNMLLVYSGCKKFMLLSTKQKEISKKSSLWSLPFTVFYFKQLQDKSQFVLN